MSSLNAAVAYSSAECYLERGDDAAAEACFRAVIAGFEAQETPRDDIACRYNHWADARCSRGKYDDVSEAHYAQALRLLEAIKGADHPDVANVLNNLAALAHARGWYANAARYSSRSRRIVEDVLARVESGFVATDADTLGAIRHIHLASLTHEGTALRSEGRYAAAEELYRKALQLADSVFPGEIDQRATCLGNLGVLCKYAGRYDEAAQFYGRALTMLGAETLRGQAGANLLYNLGGLAHARGRYEEAEPFARRAIELAAAHYGRDHSDYGVKIAGLAAILEGQGRYSESEQTYREALAVLERSVGADHPDVALTLSNLGAVAEAQGRRHEAESLYRRALNLCERRLGADSPQAAVSLNSLAVLLRDVGRYQEAVPCYRRALAIFERFQGDHHPHTLACREGFAKLLRLTSGASRSTL